MAFKPEQRFWQRVSISPDCWNWSGKTNSDGYGRLRVRGKQVAAHRFSYTIHKGPITDGLWVLHKCDNPRCVNPEHLYLGDAAQNSRDAVQRNRMAKGDKNGSRTHAAKRMANWLQWRTSQPYLTKGERNGRAKLDTTQVRKIRLLFETGVITRTALAKHFGVSWTLINKIIRRELWAHVA